MKKVLSLIVGGLMLLALASFAVPSAAKADPSCNAWITLPGFPPIQVCAGYTMPAGGQVCTGTTPGANEALLYNATNYGGVCMKATYGSAYWPDLGTSGWKNSVRSMKVGTSVHVGACNGVWWGADCSIMGYPYGQNYPNTAGGNWSSLQVTSP